MDMPTTLPTASRTQQIVPRLLSQFHRLSCSVFVNKRRTSISSASIEVWVMRQIMTLGITEEPAREPGANDVRKNMPTSSALFTQFLDHQIHAETSETRDAPLPNTPDHVGQ